MRVMVVLGLAGLCLAGSCLGSCGSNGKNPSGQVVANVDGHEITAAQMNLELGNAADANPKARAAVVKALAARQLLVQEAKRRGLDKSLTGELARERARDLALVEVLRSDVAKTVSSNPSSGDIEKYIAANGNAFAQRQLIRADQLIVPQADQGMLERLRSSSSLDDARSYLASADIPSNRSKVVLDTIFLDPASADAMMKAQLGAIIVVPAKDGSAARMVQLLDRQPAPLLGGEARSAARSLLAQQGNARLKTALEGIVHKGQSKVSMVSAPSNE